MKSAPDHLQFAYAKLTEYVFCHIRNGTITEPHQLRDLADAMHNVSGILADYGSWVDDSKYRELYLRHYDQVWGHLGLKLEQCLDDFISIYQNKQN